MPIHVTSIQQIFNHDNSYPGFVALSATEGLFSFYSSHEGSGTSLAPSAIYLARLSLDVA